MNTVCEKGSLTHSFFSQYSGNELEDIPGHFRVQLHGADGSFFQRIVQEQGAVNRLTSVQELQPTSDAQVGHFDVA